ncbi:hypothetical protein BDZ89DRAFT_1068863 [Hymenopellis radicata]|nr:hypothetical protein BDZ89DRAFT_1068863 [Hymenopellis radicata]
MSSLLILACSIAVAVAQNVSRAECSNPGYSWTFNSLKQSPCQIVEALASQCLSDASFYIQPLPTGKMYSGLGGALVMPCACNTVFYSLLTVCAQCQGGDIAPFSNWSKNCTVSYTNFQGQIPAGTVVPDYAYHPLLRNGRFDVNSAVNAVGQKQQEAASLHRAAIPRRIPTASPSSAPSSGGGSGAAGAIAGAVVGGLALIGVGAIFVFYLLKKRRKTDSSKEPEPIMDVWTEPSAPLFTGSNYPPFSAPRVYNPNDPSTYPFSGSAFRQEDGGQWNPPSYQSHAGAASPTTMYQGAPEM